MKFEAIHHGIADHDTSFDLINRGYSPEDRFEGQWFETVEAIYDHFLNVLPPLDYAAIAFSMCEFATGDLTDCFIQIGDRYYCLCIARRSSADFRTAVAHFQTMISSSRCESVSETASG
jgi:hypothetical protein